jgi:phosphopantetheinyl transferase (holo-ACP synthase)
MIGNDMGNDIVDIRDIADVGNDIVDLRDPDSDSTSYHSRFDERVFSDAERRSIDRAQAPEHQRWRLWAAKEASYKLARKRDPETVFSPRAFAVECDDDNACDYVRVDHKGSACFVKFDETPERIHAIAVPTLADFTRVLSGIRMIDPSDAFDDLEAESVSVRELACSAVSRRFDYPLAQLEIRKSEDRIPRLSRGEDRLDDSLSLSHHGSWIAFACRTKKLTGEVRGA